MAVKFPQKNYYVYVAAFTAFFGSFIMGTGVSWTSPVMIKLSSLEDNPLGRKITSSEKGYLGSISVVGIILGALLAAITATKFGRKPTFLLMACPSLVSYIILLFSKTIWWFYLARIIGGISGGGMPIVCILYYAEVAETKNRGFLGGSMNIFLNFGFLFSFSIGPYVSFAWFQIILATCPITYVILILLLLPESPHYLVTKDIERAEVALRRLRGSKDVAIELSQIKEFVEQKVDAPLKGILFDKGVRRGLFIGCGLLIFQQCTGVSAIMSYCQTIFEEIKFLPSEVSVIIIACSQFIFSFITPLVTDKSGRKILLIVSHIGVAISLSIFGVYFFMKNNGHNVDSIDWLPLTALVSFKLFFAIGSGSVPWIIIGEIFPLEVKEAATFFVGTVLVLCSFVNVLCYNWLVDGLGMAQTYWIYSFSSIIATVFVIFFVLETKGKSLLKIQEEISC